MPRGSTLHRLCDATSAVSSNGARQADSLRAACTAECARSCGTWRREESATCAHLACGTQHLCIAGAVRPPRNRGSGGVKCNHDEPRAPTRARAVTATAATATARSRVGRGIAAGTNVRSTQASYTVNAAGAATTSAQPTDARRPAAPAPTCPACPMG